MNSAQHRNAVPLRRCAWVPLVLLSLLGAPAQEAKPPLRQDYSSFGIIAERNIFNANRSGRSMGPRSDEPRRESRVDAFSLVGTLSYEKGPFAFFDGTSSEYRKVLQPEGTIAGYKVTNITGSSVKLETGTNQVVLRVGMQMRREEGGEWHAGEASGTYASYDRGGGSGDDHNRRSDAGSDDHSRRSDPGSDGRSRRWDPGSDGRSRRSDPGSAGPSRSSETSSGADMSEVLKRLMQKREQETK